VGGDLDGPISNRTRNQQPTTRNQQLIPLINTPHQFVAHGIIKCVSFDTDGFNREVGTFDQYFDIGIENFSPGVQ